MIELQEPLKLDQYQELQRSSELDPILSSVPWRDAFNMGAGFDAVTGDLMDTAVEPFEVREGTYKSSTETYEFIREESELNKQIGLTASGAYNSFVANVSSSNSYLSNLNYSAVSITLMAKYERIQSSYDLSRYYALTPKAKEMMIAHPDRFRQAYGDYFIAGGQRGSRFVALYLCRGKSSNSMTEFKTEFAGGAPDVFTAKGSAKFMKAAKQHDIHVKVKLYMIGYEGQAPGGDFTPEDVLKRLEWFKQHDKKGIYLYSELHHYSTLDAEYPRRVDVSPATFVDLHQLYTKVWEVRARYHACPRVYSSDLEKDFIDLDTGIKANKSALATNEHLRRDYDRQATSLRSRLRHVFSRMALYFKVKDARKSEPKEGRGHAIEPGNGGVQRWLYGYQVFPDVSIKTHYERFKKDWEVGWRDHTFRFGPDQTKLIVGWQVVSHREDGLNGEWWKAVEEILFGNHGVVQIQGDYDRGVDYAVAFYWVDADEYRFE